MTKRFVTRYDEDPEEVDIEHKDHAFLYHSSGFSDLYVCQNPECAYNKFKTPVREQLEVIINKYKEAVSKLINK